MEISIGTYKCRLEICLLIIVVAWILLGHMLCSCCLLSFKEGLDTLMGNPTPAPEHTSAETQGSAIEGFTNVGANNVASGPEFSGAKEPGYIMSPDKWAQPTLTYSPGATPDAGVQAILNRPKQPIPLPEGELDMFATTEFKPECCPNAYSSSTGCACMTLPQYQYLQNRGSNNVPYSEY
jgi:hypothetical protein